jgi:hypothetical protein
MSDPVTKLYRGVDLARHERGDGLKPRGTKAKQGITYGQEGVTYDSGVQYGETEVNGVWTHQHGKKSYEGSAWLSTTPDFQAAKEYALHSSVDGVVYEIDPATFAALGVRASRVNDIVHFPEDRGQHKDDEHSLLADPPGPLPGEIVVREIRVSRSWYASGQPRRDQAWRSVAAWRAWTSQCKSGHGCRATSGRNGSSAGVTAA